MDIFGQSYDKIVWDLRDVYKSDYTYIYIIGMVWLTWLLSWYFGILGVLGLFVWFGTVIYGIYMIDIIWTDRYDHILPSINYKIIRWVISVILVWSIFYFLENIQSKIFLSLLVLWILRNIDSRIWAVLALWSLIWIILMLLVKLDWKAEILAVWLYYFLVISVFCGLFEKNEEWLGDDSQIIS